MMKSSRSTLSQISGLGKSIRDKTKKMARMANDLVTQSRRSNDLSFPSKPQTSVRQGEVRADLSREADRAESDLSLGYEGDEASSHLSSEDASGAPFYEANPAVAGHPLVKKMTATVSKASELLEELAESAQGHSHGFMINVKPKQAILDELEDCFKASKASLDNARPFQKANAALWNEAWALHRMMEHIFHVEARDQ